VLNASNEIAVAAFLERRLAFDRIHAVNLRTLESLAPPTLGSLDDLLALDAQAREVAQSVARQWSL
jgi:1-deoxy-D-xylulose-5-phosphate reductoisomerase